MAKDKAAKAEKKAAAARGSKLAEKQAADANLDLSSYATKAPTDLHVRYAQWLVDKVGLTLSAKERALFDKAVSISTALRMPFQRSEENQTARAERAAAPKPAKAPKAAKAEAEAKPAKGKGAKGKKAAAAVAEPEPEATPAAEAAPAAEEAAAPKPAKRAPRKAGAKSKAPF
jgi:hypothetical protein